MDTIISLMDEMCVDTIDKYYINLDYAKIRSSKHNTVSAITKTINFKGDNFLERIEGTLTTIQDNHSLFKYVLNHPDIIISLMEYLNQYKNMQKLYKLTSEKAVSKQDIWTLVLTLFNFSAKPEIQNFFEISIIKNSSADNHSYMEYKNLLSHQIIEIVVLEDADLYAIISYMKMSENYRYLSKIWVAQPIENNFLSFQNQYFINLNIPIHVFKSKQELITPPIFYKINTTSIWSEDITTAKSLAITLDRNIVLINTLDFYEKMVTMPYIEIFKVTLHKHLELDENQHIISTIKPLFRPKKRKRPNIPNRCYQLLFYDGKWQEPVKDDYWLNKHTLVANATGEDIDKCIVSAKKGFKIWSTLSTKSRMRMLSKFAFALEHNGKAKLSKIVLKWIKFPHWYETSWISQFPTYTIIRTRRPKGIIMLMEKDEADLFCKLTQSLVIGNSVIVIYTIPGCSIAQYCDMLSTSGIPPGVINLLSFEDMKPLSDCYDASELNDIYLQFTRSKQIVVNETYN